MSIILTRHVGTGSGGASGGAYTYAEKRNMELFQAFRAAQLSYYSEFTYTQNDLTSITIYEDDTKAVTLFTKDFSYTQQNDLDRILLTREDDGAQLLKIFEYTQNDLTSITVSAGP